MKLNKYGDILIDLDEVTLLIGSAVVMKDGKMYDIGVKAADAIRTSFLTTSPGKEYHNHPLKGNSEK